MPPGLQAPPVQSFDQANAGLASIYDPQTASVNSQIAALAPQQAAQMSSLDQAKVNAFRGIDNTANSRGMLFSGFTPDQQAQYTGTKYLPAVANLQTSFNNAKTGLTDTLNKINANRYTQAQDIVTKGQQAANDAAYKNQQLYNQQQQIQVAQQNANTNAYRASSSAGIASAKAAAGPKPTTQNVTSQLRSLLQQNKLVGGNGHVGPATLAAMYNTWMGYGLQDKGFWTAFQGYWDPNQGNYQQMFNAAKNAN